MYKKYKQILKKHIKTIKSIYPELYVEVRMINDDIVVHINSFEIYDSEEYDDLIYIFTKEYDKKGIFNIFWGVNISLTHDKLHLLENDVKTPNNVSNKVSNKVSAKAYV